PTTTSAPPTSASALGTTEQYGYGELAVRLTVSGSKITDAQVVGLQTAESYSQQIADQVIPYLRREVLSVQSAQIDAISGATYTSQAYALSVQSALDQLHRQ
ncbi:MAG: FMN-binding protein, partial [Acidobacteriota bacterium]|nr:FMN-binding protein [Acidobacteriota bacterium]